MSNHPLFLFEPCQGRVKGWGYAISNAGRRDTYLSPFCNFSLSPNGWYFLSFLQNLQHLTYHNCWSSSPYSSASFDMPNSPKAHIVQYKKQQLQHNNYFMSIHTQLWDTCTGGASLCPWRHKTKISTIIKNSCLRRENCVVKSGLGWESSYLNT